MLRLTAKSTQFGRGTFTSWLIESAGTLPIKRRKDFGNENVDNSVVMARLIDVCAVLYFTSSLIKGRHLDVVMPFAYSRKAQADTILR
jgi:hypothetical protein